MKKQFPFLLYVIGFFSVFNSATINAQTEIPDPNQGLRAEWMRGTYGLNWKPVKTGNGNSENIYIDNFLDQIDGLRSLDYIQVHLGESSTTSPVHLGPHAILESLWQGDTDANGNIINLVVPRASIGRDPFLDMLNAIKAKGLKTQVYVNSSNMLLRSEEQPNPSTIPNITERWKNWCDTNPQAKAYLDGLREDQSIDYKIDGNFPNRKYMFCYAEFVLKEYAVRYGDLIDAWIFDSAKFMTLNGDKKGNGKLKDQLIYKAFADACHTGNENAPVAFNNSLGSANFERNAYAPATLFDDYTFGHPFGGGKNGGEKKGNENMMRWAIERNGFPFTEDPREDRTWDDNVVAHYDPPISKTAWNGGSESALTDEQIVDWYGSYLLHGGAVSLGVPLESKTDFDRALVKDFGMEDLEILDAYLIENQNKNNPNWSRQETILTDAYTGQEYSHKLKLDEDFWGAEGEDINDLLIVANDNSPSWLTIEKSGDNYVLTGTVSDTQVKSYSFRLRLKSDGGAKNNRRVTLNIIKGTPTPPTEFAIAQIKATANTNYGTGATATMTSAVLTAPDGLATYQVELKVTPQNNKAIVSGVTGGDTSSKSWGLNNKIFNGTNDDSVESISGLVIKNFKANGSKLTISDVVYESITITNGKSSNDAIKLELSNGTILNFNKLASNTDVIKLNQENSATPITSFKLGIGNQGVNKQAKNKWSVEGINVKVSFEVENTTPINEATLYVKCDFEGQNISLAPGEYPNIKNAGFKNDVLSSLKVPNGYEVVVYQHFNFGGSSRTFKADDTCLVNDNFDNAASSLKIQLISEDKPDGLNISFAAPLNGATLTEGSELDVEVLTTNNSLVSKILLYLNDEFVRKELHAPYEWGNPKQNDAILENLAAGTYELRAVATDKSGNVIIKSITIVVQSTSLNSEQNSANSVQAKVYPNPTTDHISINIEDLGVNEKVNVMVSDMTGRVSIMNAGVRDDKTIKVDLLGLQKGMYVITIQSDSRKPITKLISIR